MADRGSFYQVWMSDIAVRQGSAAVSGSVWAAGVCFAGVVVKVLFCTEARLAIAGEWHRATRTRLKGGERCSQPSGLAVGTM